MWDPWWYRFVDGADMLQYLPGKQKPGEPNDSQGHSYTDVECYIYKDGGTGCKLPFVN